MMNVDQITTRLSMMDDAALQKFAAMNKNDPYLLPLAISESNRRQRVRMAGQAQQAQPQPPIADAAIAQMRPAPAPAPAPQMAAAGIPQLAARNIETMADGGIAGYATGGVTKEERETYRSYAIEKARQLGLDPKFVDAIFQTESGYNPNARSKTGPVGIGQLTRRTARALGLDPYERRDPYKNMDAAMSHMKDLFRKYKDPAKVAIAYNQGEGVLNEHLKQNRGQIVPERLHENVRTANKQEPVNYLNKISSYAGLPSLTAAAPTKPKPKPKREEFVGLSPEIAKQITEALPFASAQAGELPRAVDGYTRSADGRTVSGPVSAPRYEGQRFPQKDTAGLPSLPPRKAEKAAPADDAMYSPEGIPLIAPQGGPDTKAPTTALLTGTADVLLGIPEAVANVVAQDIYNMPYGKQYSWKEAREAAQNNPVVKAAGMLRSGKWFGVENDPAYQKDPLSLIASLPALGAEGVAEKFGLDKDAARLAVENAMVFAPMVGKVKQVQYNMPKLKGKEAPTITPELAQNAVKQALDEVKAAERKTEAPRLGMSTGETPGVVRATPEGQGVLPTGEAVAREKAGLKGLAEDQLALAAAKRRAAEAEAVAAQSSKVPGTKSLAERFGGAPFATRAAVPYGMLSASTDVSPSFMGGKDEDDVVRAADLGSQEFPATPPSGATPFPTPVAEEKAPPSVEGKKAFGLDNEDLLMLGLGMLASPGGQPGGELSQLFSNFGRSGLATVASKREREKLAEEKEYRNVMKQYYGKLADNLGNTEQERMIAKVMQEYKVDRLEAIKRIAQAQYDPKMAAMFGVQSMKNEMSPMSMLQGVGGASDPMIESLVNKYAR